MISILYLSVSYPFPICNLSFCDPILYLSFLGFQLCIQFIEIMHAAIGWQISMARIGFPRQDDNFFYPNFDDLIRDHFWKQKAFKFGGKFTVFTALNGKTYSKFTAVNMTFSVNTYVYVYNVCGVFAKGRGVSIDMRSFPRIASF